MISLKPLRLGAFVKTAPTNMNKKTFYLVGGVVAAAIIFFCVVNTKNRSFAQISTDRIAESPLPVTSSSKSMSVNNNPVPPAEREIGKDNADANQKEFDEEAKREIEYKKWLKENRMENEGVKPFDSETRGIAGGLQQYYETFQSYPEGGNREMAKALFGDNPRKLRILNWPERRLSEDGEFLDPWGTAYQIQATREKIEIRSAGPNRVFWDSDDQVAK